jgi:HlyD family secretion protein
VGELLCSIPNDKMELKPNTTVDIRIQFSERRGVLTLPRAAVEVAGARRYVYLIDGDRLRRREIKVGVSNDTQFEIVEGLSEGDTAALPGDVALQDGLLIRVDSAQ